MQDGDMFRSDEVEVILVRSKQSEVCCGVDCAPTMLARTAEESVPDEEVVAQKENRGEDSKVDFDDLASMEDKGASLV